MRVKTWKIIDRGLVPEDAQMVPYECECGREAEIPVSGRVLALAAGGIVFDGAHAMPPVIQCRKCGRVLENVR